MTRSRDATDASWYHLAILKDKMGQNYIQIRKVPAGKFESITGRPLGKMTHGTVVRVHMREKIPLADKDLDDVHHHSQKGLIRRVHERFAWVSSVEVLTKVGDQPMRRVNQMTPEQRQGRVLVAVDDHSIMILDDGDGMDDERINRMFVPEKGDKQAEILSGERAREELQKTKVVHRENFAHTVSFARKERVVVAVKIPRSIHPSAVVKGGLMFEFGGLLDVSEEWNKVILPSEINPNPEEIPNFQLAAGHMIDEIIQSSLSNLEKVQQVNTFIVGLEGLAQGGVYQEGALAGQRHLSIRG